MARKTMNSNVDKSIKITCRKCKTSTSPKISEYRVRHSDLCLC